jgi:hypothetical protein
MAGVGRDSREGKGAWGSWAGAEIPLTATRRPSTAGRRDGSGRWVREDIGSARRWAMLNILKLSTHRKGYFKKKTNLIYNSVTLRRLPYKPSFAGL